MPLVRTGSRYRDPDIAAVSSSQPFSHLSAFASSSQTPEQPESGPEQALGGDELCHSPRAVAHSVFQLWTLTACEVFAGMGYSASPSGLRTPRQKQLLVRSPGRSRN